MIRKKSAPKAPKAPIAPNPNRFAPVGLEWDNAKGSSQAGESSIAVEGEVSLDLKVTAHLYREDNGTFKPTTRLTITHEHDGVGEEWYEIADVVSDDYGGIDVSIQGITINPKATLDTSGPTSGLLAMCGIDHMALRRLAALAASADARLAEELARQVPELPALLRGVEESIWRPKGAP